MHRPNTFATEKLWRKLYSDQTPHSRNVWLNESELKVIQPQHNKWIRRLTRDKRIAEIFASTELIP